MLLHDTKTCLDRFWTKWYMPKSMTSSFSGAFIRRILILLLSVVIQISGDEEQDAEYS